MFWQISILLLLTAVGVSPAGDWQGLSFHDPSLTLQAALDGLGIAMGYLDLIEPAVASGRLVRPFIVQQVCFRPNADGQVAS